MDEIHNDKDLINIRKMGNLINTASYHKRFSFNRHNINCMIYCLDNWIVMNMNV